MIRNRPVRDGSTRDSLPNKIGDILGAVRCGCTNTKEWQASSFEDLIDELVSILPVTSSMARIIEFDTHDGIHGRQITEQEVHMLSVNLVAVRLIFVGASDEKDVGQVHLEAYEV